MPSSGASIVMKTDRSRLAKHLLGKVEEATAHIVGQLQYIGERCVETARMQGSYNDITGNLRSSIGYTILVDGKPVVTGKPRQYKQGAEGVEASQKLLERLASEFPRGIALIVVAGKDYAAYVEEIHHRDVLTSAEQVAKSLVGKLLSGTIE